jgi:formamidopyrimidine-DNA glycosylase
MYRSLLEKRERLRKDLKELDDKLEVYRHGSQQCAKCGTLLEPGWHFFSVYCFQCID